MNCNKSDITEAEFIDFRTGCSKSFRVVFDRYHQILYRHIYSVSKDSVQSEDVLQDAFLKLFLNKDKINSASHIYPYLFITVKHALMMLFRRKVIEAKYSNSLISQEHQIHYATEERIYFNDLKNVVGEIQHSLPSQQQEAFYLSRIMGMSYEEIAIHKGTSRHTVKNQIISATKKIKRELQKYYLFFF